MDINNEVNARLKAILGELQVQLIVVTVNLEVAQARIKELESKEPVK